MTGEVGDVGIGGVLVLAASFGILVLSALMLSDAISREEEERWRNGL